MGILETLYLFFLLVKFLRCPRLPICDGKVSIILSTVLNSAVLYVGDLRLVALSVIFEAMHLNTVEFVRICHVVYLFAKKKTSGAA